MVLVPNDLIDTYLDGMKKDYFEGLEAAKRFPDSSSYIFPTKPGRGAVIYKCAE